MVTIDWNALFTAIGYGMLHSIWQGAFILLLYYLVVSVFNLSAAEKYKLAVLGGLLLVLLFVGTIVSEVASPGHPAVTYWTGLLFRAHSAEISAFINQWLLPGIALLYSIIAMLLLIRLLLGWLHITHLRHQPLQKAPVQVRLFVQETAGWLQLTHPVSIWLSKHIQTPMTVGFWKPMILLPISITTQLTAAQLEAVLIHELAHIKRNDYLLNIGLQMTQSLLIFNPFAQQLLKIAYAEREFSCDDWVLQLNYDNKLYAQALLNIGKASLQPAMAMGIANQQHGSLIQRVGRLAGRNKSVALNMKTYIGRTLSLILVLAIINFASLENKQHIKALAQYRSDATAAYILKQQLYPLMFDWLMVSKTNNAPAAVAKKYAQKNNSVNDFVQPEPAINAPFNEDAPLLPVSNTNKEEIIAALLPELPANIAMANEHMAELENLSAALAHQQALLQAQMAEVPLQQSQQLEQVQQEMAKLNRWKQWLKTIMLENKETIETLQKAKLLENVLKSTIVSKTGQTPLSSNGFTLFESNELKITIDDTNNIIIQSKGLDAPNDKLVEATDSNSAKIRVSKRIIAL